MQTVNLNFIPGKIMPVVNVSQYDEGRAFALAIYDGTSTATLTNASFKINGRKPDNKGFSYDQTETVKGNYVISVASNVVTIRTTKQMTAVKGDTLASLNVIFSAQDIRTLNFILRCQEDPLADVDISETVLPGIIDAAEQNAERAETAATNASASAESAATSAQNASTSATNASTSAGNASTSATNAQNAATRAESALVFSVIAATPTISLSYDPKINSFIKYIGLDSPLNANDIDLSLLCDNAKYIIDNKDNLSEYLAQRCNVMRELSLSDAETVVKLSK